MLSTVRSRVVAWGLVAGAIYAGLSTWAEAHPAFALDTPETITLLASILAWGVVGGLLISKDAGWGRVVVVAGIGSLVLLAAFFGPYATRDNCSDVVSSCDTAAGAGFAVFAGPVYAVMIIAVGSGRLARRFAIN